MTPFICVVPIFLLRNRSVMLYNKLLSMLIWRTDMNEGPVVRDDEKKKKSSEALDWLQCIVTALIAAILIFTFIARTITVVGTSMVPTLENGNLLIVSRLFYQPKRGDIVVLRKASFMSDPIVKRVIATEGQTVDIDFSAGIVYVDGTALEEPYVNELTYEREDFTEPVTVPEGHVFVMGDNRNRSTDSRDARVGCVDTRELIGRAILRLAPLNEFGKIG